MFSLRARQSSLTISLQVLFGLPLGLGSSTSYSMHFFTQSSSSFRLIPVLDNQVDGSVICSMTNYELLR